MCSKDCILSQPKAYLSSLSATHFEKHGIDSQQHSHTLFKLSLGDETTQLYAILTPQLSHWHPTAAGPELGPEPAQMPALPCRHANTVHCVLPALEKVQRKALLRLPTHERCVGLIAYFPPSCQTNSPRRAKESCQTRAGSHYASNTCGKKCQLAQTAIGIHVSCEADKTLGLTLLSVMPLAWRLKARLQ